MKVFGTLIVRNEVDIVRLSILYQLSLGLDRVLVLDNGSTDGTADVLAELARGDDRIQWTSDAGLFQESPERTELAREAFRQGADWVVPFDADEFWWIPGGDLRAALATTAAGALRGLVVNFVQRRDTMTRSPDALMTMTRRVRREFPPAPELVMSKRIGYVEDAYPPKWIFRPSAEIVVEAGSHLLSGLPAPPGELEGLEVLHAPLRSRDCLERKADHGERALQTNSPPIINWHLKRWARLREAGQLDQEWAANSYQGMTLDVFGTRRRLAVDFRLRDAVAPFLAAEPTDDRPERSTLTAREAVPLPIDATGTALVSEAMAETVAAAVSLCLKTTTTRVVAAVGAGAALRIAQLLNGEGELHVFDRMNRVRQALSAVHRAGLHNLDGFGHDRDSTEDLKANLRRVWDEFGAPVYDLIVVAASQPPAIDSEAMLLLDRLLKPGGYLALAGWEGSGDDAAAADAVNSAQPTPIMNHLPPRDGCYRVVIEHAIFAKRDGTTARASAGVSLAG